MLICNNSSTIGRQEEEVTTLSRSYLPRPFLYFVFLKVIRVHKLNPCYVQSHFTNTHTYTYYILISLLTELFQINFYVYMIQLDFIFLKEKYSST